MSNQDTSLGGPGGSFPSTSWTLISAAGHAESPDCRGHLERLIGMYWKPAYSYLRTRWTVPVEDAKDLTQDFFARMLEKGQVGKLQPERGSFRGFLKRALQNFMIDAARRERARKPPEGARLLRFDEGVPEPGGSSPDEAFDREWIRSVMDASLEALRVRLEAEGKAGHFDVFREYCLSRPADGGTYTQLADKLGLTETNVRKRLEYCRTELRKIVRDKVREYVRDDGEIESEYREILGG